MTWAELLTLQLAYRSIPFSGKLIFAKEFWLDERTAKACGAIDLYNHVRYSCPLFLVNPKCVQFIPNLTVLLLFLSTNFSVVK